MTNERHDQLGRSGPTLPEEAGSFRLHAFHTIELVVGASESHASHVIRPRLPEDASRQGCIEGSNLSLCGKAKVFRVGLPAVDPTSRYSRRNHECASKMVRELLPRTPSS